MPRIAATALNCLRAFVTISIPTFYLLIGLYCWLHDFYLHQTVIVGIVYLLVFIASQRAAIECYKLLISFMCYVIFGLLVSLVTWFGWGTKIYTGFPLFIFGGIAWSIVSWVCTIYLSLLRASGGRLHTGSPIIIKRANQFLVLAVPMIITSIVGVIFASTDPNVRFLSDRLEDFFSVMQLGVGCSLFLALPWFCLPFALKFWTQETAGGTDEGD